jgi:hypothetical protein
LVTSLQDFRERLAGIKDVIATSRDQWDVERFFSVGYLK